VPVHELRDVAHKLLAVREVVQNVERVDGVRVLRHGDLLGARGAERVGVRPLPVLVHVPSADAHQRGRERPPPVVARARVPPDRGGHVGSLVVPRGAGGQERAPQPRQPLGATERGVAEPQLRLRGRLAAEEWLHGDQPRDGVGEARGDVVRNVAAGAVPGHEDGSGGGRRQRASRAGEDPPEGCLAVVVLRREAVLGREAVVDGGDDGWDGGR